MIIRVRTNAGLWRVENLSETSTPSDVLAQIATTRPDVKYETPLSFDPACKSPIDVNVTLASQNLKHGSMVHCKVDPSTCATSDNTTSNNIKTDNSNNASTSTSKQPSSNTKRIIGSDGSIQLIHDDTKTESTNSFRKGMLPLRDMKMQWTLQEFVDMDDRFTFKIQRQEERWVGEGGVSLDMGSADGFQSYLRNFEFRRQRFGLLYGKFINEDDKEEDGETIEETKLFGTAIGTKLKKKKNKKVIVEAIYEPPQEADPDAAEGFVALDDPMEEQVEKLAEMLGLRRVGWIFGHPPREEGFQLSSSEVIMAAEYQLESAEGVEETPFVTVKVTMGDDGNVSFEAFQVSRQCMEMAAEGALEVGPNPGFCAVNETFTAIQEGKESKTVENNFFLTTIPITQHTSDAFVSEFPRANRDLDNRQQTHDEMKKQLSKSGSAGWTFIDLLADFNLLIYLCKFLDVNADIPKICQSIKDRDVPLDEGYKLIIASMAGLDNAY